MSVWTRSSSSPFVLIRLRALLARVGGFVPASRSSDVLALLDGIDRAAIDVIGELEGAQHQAALYRAAIEAAPLAVVFAEGGQNNLICSREANMFLSGGAAALLPDRLLGEVISRARSTGERSSDTFEVFGPPRRTLSVTAVPVVVPPRVPMSGGVSAAAVKASNKGGQARQRDIVAVIEDVTERWQAETARRDMVTNVSHELRTPVGAIAVLAEALAAEDDPESIHLLSQRLDMEAQRLTATLNDVLALSRLEANRQGDRTEINFGELIAFRVSQMRASAQRAGLELELKLTDDHLLVVGDVALLGRAIDNLLENAIKYSDKGEPVEVEVLKTHRPDGTYAELSVRDTGIGIPIRERQRIFERFYRVDRARSRDSGGSGLGLAIVRHVAVSHDGEVEVDSLEGVGSTFRFRVPLLA